MRGLPRRLNRPERILAALGTLALCGVLLASAPVAAVGVGGPGASLGAEPASLSGDDPAQPQRLVVSLEPGEVEGNGEATLAVSVANTSPNELRGVSVRIEADDARVVTPKRVTSSLQPGGGATFNYTLEDVSPGSEGFDIWLHYTDTEGSRHGEYRARTVDFPASSEVHPDVAIGADEVSPGGRTKVNLTVANGLDESIRSMTVQVAPEDFSVSEPRRVASGLQSGQARAFVFQASAASSGRTEVPVTVSYTTESGVQRSFEQTLGLTMEAVRNPARVTLTELRVTAEGDRLTVRGSASNVGGGDATGVVVSVEDGDGVGPASSESTFFVGQVPASDFSSFEVAAELRSDEPVEIPIRVSYAADDDRTNRTMDVRYVPNVTTETPVEQSGGGGGDGGSLPAIAIGALVVLTVGVVVWRQFG